MKPFRRDPEALGDPGDGGSGLVCDCQFLSLGFVVEPDLYLALPWSDARRGWRIQAKWLHQQTGYLTQTDWSKVVSVELPNRASVPISFKYDLYNWGRICRFGRRIGTAEGRDRMVAHLWRLVRIPRRYEYCHNV